MAKILRPGKTEKDHKSGAWARRYVNRAIRAAYQTIGNTDPFPAHVCNGKKNRSRYMGKGGRIVVLHRG